jgi:hypothetical protein
MSRVKWAITVNYLFMTAPHPDVVRIKMNLRVEVERQRGGICIVVRRSRR